MKAEIPPREETRQDEQWVRRRDGAVRRVGAREIDWMGLVWTDLYECLSRTRAAGTAVQRWLRPTAAFLSTLCGAVLVASLAGTSRLDATELFGTVTCVTGTVGCGYATTTVTQQIVPTVVNATKMRGSRRRRERRMFMLVVRMRRIPCVAAT